MNKFYIYMYLDSNNVPFYIGKGKDSRYYVKNHLGTTNNLLKNKIRKIGAINVKIHFLHKNLTEEEAFYWERYWIKYIGRRDLKEGSLVNLTNGGEGDSGHIFSEEHKRKISVALIGNQCAKGHKLSEEVKKGISEALIGRKHSEDAKRKMKGKQKGNQYAKGYRHTKEAKQAISRALKGREKSEETRRKLKRANKGQIPWNKGKKHSEGTKQKMRDAKRVPRYEKN